MHRFAQDSEIDVGEVAGRLRRMTDAELIRFGRAAASLCEPRANGGRLPRETFAKQLAAARQEWRRRKDQG